jgi:GT2 family glycosyltransferase
MCPAPKIPTGMQTEKPVPAEKQLPIFVTMIYHSMKGDTLSRALESLSSLNYPKERIFLCLIDNYSKDGAFDFCKNWLKKHGENYGGVLHIRAAGNPSRLRNIALKTAQELKFKYLAFIDSDIIIDKDFLNRGLELISKEPSIVCVSTVWDVGYENLDFLERLYAKYLKARRANPKHRVSRGEACNTAACLINLETAKSVGYFDEDIRFIEDLDWGRRATRKGLTCLFDSRVIVKHLRRYSLREIRKYFFAGARSEAKLFLKNKIASSAVKSILYWDALLTSIFLSPLTYYPLLALLAGGFLAYSRRAVGIGRLTLYPLTLPFRLAKSLALSIALIYWLIRGGYNSEKVTITDQTDYEVVEFRKMAL